MKQSFASILAHFIFAVAVSQAQGLVEAPCGEGVEENNKAVARAF